MAALGKMVIEVHVVGDGILPADQIDWTGTGMPREWRNRLVVVNFASSAIGVMLGFGVVLLVLAGLR